MTATERDVKAAAERTHLARIRLNQSIADAKYRLKPGTIAHDAVESAADGAASAARKGVDAARAKPIVTASVLGAVGMFLARGWIGRKLAERRARKAAVPMETVETRPAPLPAVQPTAPHRVRPHAKEGIQL